MINNELKKNPKNQRTNHTVKKYTITSSEETKRDVTYDNNNHISKTKIKEYRETNTTLKKKV